MDRTALGPYGAILSDEGQQLREMCSTRDEGRREAPTLQILIESSRECLQRVDQSSRLTEEPGWVLRGDVGRERGEFGWMMSPSRKLWEVVLVCETREIHLSKHRIGRGARAQLYIRPITWQEREQLVANPDKEIWNKTFLHEK